MFVDYVSITVKAGNGGDGKVSFHREKYVMNGGPDGGDGGKGGDIVFIAAENMHTLLDFRFHRKFFAKNGENGAAGRQTGKSAEDLVIRVPVGTVIKDKDSGAIIADMHEKDMRKVAFTGGRGGAGNARFATPVRQAPNFAKPGQKTEAFSLILELKTIADVGLVGFPNVGKSTLLSVVSAAKPKIANYHFTTLEPNLGVVNVDDDGFVMADIPGLIEGAAEGIGLGHAFLRHVERTRLLLHIIDMSGCEGRNPLEDYDAINTELKKYGRLFEKPRIVVANKMDLPGAQEYLFFFKEAHPDVEVFEISALARQGLAPLLREVVERLDTIEKPAPFIEDFIMPQADGGPAYVISLDEDGVYSIGGSVIENLINATDFYDDESMAFFQRTLRRLGVIDELREKGVQQGDTIRIEDLEFDFVD
ncbi:MAG: GTPase ObgE [Christensenellales bacterium]